MGGGRGVGATKFVLVEEKKVWSLSTYKQRAKRHYSNRTQVLVPSAFQLELWIPVFESTQTRP